MNAMNILSIIAALAPAAAAAAETIHPQSGKGTQKLATAVSLIQMVLSALPLKGVSGAPEVTAGVITNVVNRHVAEANAAGGVPKLP